MVLGYRPTPVHVETGMGHSLSGLSRHYIHMQVVKHSIQCLRHLCVYVCVCVQVQKPVWGLLLQDHRAVALFREMKQLPQLRNLLYGCREVTVYALEE